MAQLLPAHPCYTGDEDQVLWRGQRVTDQLAFDAYLRERVRPCMMDEAGDFEVELQGLATTAMATNTLGALLSSIPAREDWEIGEALAHCLLEDERGIRWPWNNERDKRTPKASLPGADLVGFLVEGASVTLAIGEVKTSWDQRRPPSVMIGRSGMVHQLDELATRIDIHGALLRWLSARCRDTEFQPLYREAAGAYLRSEGRQIVLFGLLMRDTDPHELDLRNRARALAGGVIAPTRVELTAWYLPRPIQDWPTIAEGAP